MNLFQEEATTDSKKSLSKWARVTQAPWEHLSFRVALTLVVLEANTCAYLWLVWCSLKIYFITFSRKSLNLVYRFVTDLDRIINLITVSLTRWAATCRKGDLCICEQWRLRQDCTDVSLAGTCCLDMYYAYLLRRSGRQRARDLHLLNGWVCTFEWSKWKYTFSSLFVGCSY